MHCTLDFHKIKMALASKEPSDEIVICWTSASLCKRPACLKELAYALTGDPVPLLKLLGGDIPSNKMEVLEMHFVF